MTQEDKELLLRDLSARLPYGVEVYYSETVPISTLKTINSEKETCIVYDHSQWYRHNKFHIEEIKPYLRPMYSMTKEERHEIQEILGPGLEIENGLMDILDSSIHTFSLLELQAVFDWLNKNHFDYRGLIEKNLALDCTGLHIYD